MKFLIKKSPDGFIKSVNDEISSILNRNFDSFFPEYIYNEEIDKLAMPVELHEKDKEYTVKAELPGVKKEDVKAELKDGYLTISASANSNRDEQDSNGRYIRRERYSGSCSRSFYVGDQITEADIKARFENGTLTMQIPKKEEKPAVEDKKYIAIEG